MPHRINPTKFFSKLKLDPLTGCMEWQGEITKGGYGRVSIYLNPGYVHYAAHRVAAYLAGMIASPRGIEGGLGDQNVLHKCDNRKCCNPEHFFLGSHADNHFDRNTKGRQVKGHAQHLSKLTDTDVATIRAALEKGVVPTLLAKEFGVTPGVIYGTRDERFNLRTGGVVDEIRLDKILMMNEVAKIEGQHYVRGEQHGRAKLSAEDVVRIRDICGSGLFSQAAVARSFNITPSLVCSILKGRIWNT